MRSSSFTALDGNADVSRTGVSGGDVGGELRTGASMLGSSAAEISATLGSTDSVDSGTDVVVSLREAVTVTGDASEGAASALKAGAASVLKAGAASVLTGDRAS